MVRENGQRILPYPVYLREYTDASEQLPTGNCPEGVFASWYPFILVVIGVRSKLIIIGRSRFRIVVGLGNSFAANRAIGAQHRAL